MGSNPGKGHWWTTGRASGPKMLTAPAKSQLTIRHHPSPVKWGMCDVKPHHHIYIYIYMNPQPLE